MYATFSVIDNKKESCDGSNSEMVMKEEQKHMTEEEKERNAIGFTCEDGKFVYF